MYICLDTYIAYAGAGWADVWALVANVIHSCVHNNLTEGFNAPYNIRTNSHHTSSPAQEHRKDTPSRMISTPEEVQLYCMQYKCVINNNYDY